jgi:hypothetical protein
VQCCCCPCCRLPLRRKPCVLHQPQLLQLLLLGASTTLPAPPPLRFPHRRSASALKQTEEPLLVPQLDCLPSSLPTTAAMLAAEWHCCRQPAVPPCVCYIIVCLWSITEPSQTVMHVGEGEGEG